MRALSQRQPRSQQPVSLRPWSWITNSEPWRSTWNPAGFGDGSSSCRPLTSRGRCEVSWDRWTATWCWWSPETIGSSPMTRPWVTSFERETLDETTAVIFTDHDAPGITEMLTTLLRSSAGFIGVMGSRRHVAHYVQALRALGFAMMTCRGSGRRWVWTSVDATLMRSPCRSRPGWWPMPMDGTVAGWIATSRVRGALTGALLCVAVAALLPRPSPPASRRAGPQHPHRPDRRPEHRHAALSGRRAHRCRGFSQQIEDPAQPWVTFSNAFLDTPLCCPSRASILTGLTSRAHGRTDERGWVRPGRIVDLGDVAERRGVHDRADRQVPQRLPVGPRAICAAGLGPIRREAERRSWTRPTTGTT